MSQKKTFIKNKPPGMPADYLATEADGLARLRQHIEAVPECHLCIPQVESVNANSLSLEYINSVSPSDRHMQLLGEGLAALHQPTMDSYGFERNNYIGLSEQHNALSDDWGLFFVQYRLGFQIALIQDQAVKEAFDQHLRQHQTALIDFLNISVSQPSLVHGDLWAGNAMYDSDHVWLIDPAVYYGDREVDLAMTEMFGGFTASFYRAYDAVLPRSQDYPHKKVIYNLYHYLNHYNLFGSGYLNACYQGFDYIKKVVT